MSIITRGQQYVTVKVKIAAEIFDALKTASGSKSIRKCVDVASATEAMFEAIEETDDHFCIHIAMLDDEKYRLWVKADTVMSEVWERLEEVHGIERFDRNFSWGGKEMEDDDKLGNVSESSYCIPLVTDIV